MSLLLEALPTEGQSEEAPADPPADGGRVGGVVGREVQAQVGPAEEVRLGGEVICHDGRGYCLHRRIVLIIDCPFEYWWRIMRPWLESRGNEGSC